MATEQGEELWSGLGNSFVIVRETSETQGAAMVEMARRRCAEAGVDGLVTVGALDGGERVMMRIWNSDGSLGAVCGNGIRCVARYARAHNLASGEHVAVRTSAGHDVQCELLADGGVRVDMGPPVLEAAQVPFDATSAAGKGTWPNAFLLPVAAGRLVPGTVVGMGNPHVVFFADDVGPAPAADASEAEVHAQLDACMRTFAPTMAAGGGAFPDGVNVHVAHVRAREGRIVVAHWERGAGPTLACGTGSCATAVAAVLSGRLAGSLAAFSPVVVRVPSGGELTIALTAGRVSMAGAAERMDGAR